MIIDQLKNAALYYGLSHGIQKGLEFITQTNLNALSLGKHPIQGDDIFAIVEEYTTQDESESLYEGHFKYIDIQHLIVGEEKIGWFPYEGQSALETHSNDDYALYDGQGTFFNIDPHSFAIFFPNDLHKPCLTIENPMPVRKLVVKVKTTPSD